MPLNNIMLVDDSEADQFLASIIIEDYAPETTLTVACNGREALEMLAKSEQTPQFILLDINMPIMNGFEFLDAMKEKYPHAPIKVAMMSSSNTEQDHSKAEAYDCVKLYIEKPLSPESLALVKAMFD